MKRRYKKEALFVKWTYRSIITIKLRNSLFPINGIRFYVIIIDFEKIKNRLIKGDS
ncbi:hypothetical protein [Bacillus sp. DHT2]|uniref:hypothetical protein n=1 Tax=Bacillus sp. DHT2 TaxID=2994532 RepID=UPI0022492F25|nr:hypothetical protein [Bacillus sp. DHT2]